MANNVYMVEYQGRCDENKKAVGHAPKVITEYYNFIKDYCNVSVLAPDTILSSVDSSIFMDKNTLPFHIEMKGKTPFIEKITNKLHMFSNIKNAIKIADKNGVGTLWFFNVEYYIMLYLFLHKKPAHRIVATMFIDGYMPSENASLKVKIVNGIKHKIFEKAQKKIDLIIATGKKFEYKNCKHIYIPDYYYIKDEFDKYVTNNKKELAVCLGTMGRGKQLKEMVETFNRIGYELNVSGRFYDKDLVNELKSIANDNVSINDVFLSNEEYLSLLGSAKYTILPYPEENYSHQTSGVMQEAIFLRTVPVTYKSILDGNGFSGIGFKNWESIDEKMLQTDCSTLIDEYENEIKETFSLDRVSAKYKEIFG